MISVVIPTLNEEKYLERCLRSLANQTISRSNYEIIVVDGRSRDNTLKIAKKYADKIVFQKGKGAIRARNTGLKVARHQLIAYIDADTFLMNDWIEKIIREFQSNSRIISVIGKTLPIEMSFKAYFWLSIQHFYALCTSALTFPNTMGPHMAFRKIILDKCGGFNEELAGGEDYEIGYRIRKYGKISYNPSIVAFVSTRRYIKYGFLNTCITTIVDGFRTFFGKKPAQKYVYGAF